MFSCQPDLAATAIAVVVTAASEEYDQDDDPLAATVRTEVKAAHSSFLLPAFTNIILQPTKCVIK